MRIVLVLLLAATLAPAQSFRTRKTLRPGYDVARWKLLTASGTDTAQFILVGGDGSVKSWLDFDAAPVGDLVLPQAARTLLAWENVLAENARSQLIAISPGGAVAYRADERGVFQAKGESLARRARFRLRVGDPTFAGVVQDINEDGKLDLVVPGSDRTDVWVQTPKGFRRTARIEVDVDRFDTLNGTALSNDLSTTFRIPNLRTSDVNGDGRPDLLVKSGRVRAFHLQREDGSFPAEPDVTLDLRIFRDTTPKAALRPGRTLAGGDRQRYESRDLDGDGIPDYVIAHRRKVWVFHGNKNKPQFTEPTTILKVSDDITALVLVKLDEDEFPDMVLLKVQVPSAAGVVAGLVRGLEVEADALGYASEGGKGFARSPGWRSTITLKLPKLTKVLKDPGKIIERIEEAGRKFRLRRFDDFNGDGLDDTLLLSEDGQRIDYWKGNRKIEAVEQVIDFGQTVRRILFEDENKSWDLERILQFVSGTANELTETLTDGRVPDATLTFRDPAKFRRVDFATGDLDGDGRAEIVVRYAPVDRPEDAIFDIIELR
ncbi:MAG: VCBS repeat-containing protein [Planctomycetota bacterium]